MKKKTKSKPTDSFDHWLQKKLKDPEFKKHYQAEGVRIRIGIRIAELRKKAGLTQVELAKKVGVSQGFIAQLEMADTDNYEIKTLKRIASAIGMTLVIGFVDVSALSHRSTSTKELVLC
jgi:ribosome-binding protein aMBF1 (putative translation factor)